MEYLNITLQADNDSLSGLRIIFSLLIIFIIYANKFNILVFYHIPFLRQCLYIRTAVSWETRLDCIWRIGVAVGEV